MWAFFLQLTIRTLNLQTLTESSTISGVPTSSTYLGTAHKGKVYYPQGSNSLVVVDAKSLTLSLLTLNVGEIFSVLAVNAVDDYVLAMGYPSYTLYTIHPTLSTIVSKISLPGGGTLQTSIAFNPFSGVLYTTTTTAPEVLQVRHPRTFTVIASISTCAGCGSFMSYYGPANLIMSSISNGYQKWSDTCSS